MLSKAPPPLRQGGGDRLAMGLVDAEQVHGGTGGRPPALLPFLERPHAHAQHRHEIPLRDARPPHSQNAKQSQFPLPPLPKPPLPDGPQAAKCPPIPLLKP